MKHTHIRSVALTVVLAAVLVACADNSDGFEPGASIPGTDTRPPATATDPTSSDETTPDTGVPQTSAVTTEAPTPTTDAAPTSEPAPTTEPSPSTEPPPSTEPEPELAETPQAPGFDFPAADLKTDPDSPNNNRVIGAEDEPIIAAYLNAFEADMATFSKWPLDPRSPDLLASPLTDEVLSLYEQGIARRTELNQVLDISGGLTSRPYVIDDDDGDTNRVVVWDCQIDATFWKDVDTGEKAPPDAYPNVGPPGVEFGWAAALVLVDGEWLVAEGGEEPRACA